jgi:hypothetical protein
MRSSRASASPASETAGIAQAQTEKDSMSAKIEQYVTGNTIEAARPQWGTQPPPAPQPQRPGLSSAEDGTVKPRAAAAALFVPDGDGTVRPRAAAAALFVPDGDGAVRPSPPAQRPSPSSRMETAPSGPHRLRGAPAPRPGWRRHRQALTACAAPQPLVPEGRRENSPG